LGKPIGAVPTAADPGFPCRALAYGEGNPLLSPGDTRADRLRPGLGQDGRRCGSALPTWSDDDL